jgi:torulene dioxygenase
LSDVAVKGTSAKHLGTATKIVSVWSGDLPRINPKYELKAHRYVYSTLNRGKASFFDGIGKTDMQAGTTTVWEEERHTPGEPIFIPRPGATDEDDGSLLSVVFNGDASTSYLLCLDAQTMREVARAVVHMPVGLGFHGIHVPSSASRPAKM